MFEKYFFGRNWKSSIAVLSIYLSQGYLYIPMFVSSLIPSYKWKCEIFETFSLVEYKWIMTLKMDCPIFKTNLKTKTSTSCGHRIPSCQTFSYEIVRILNKSGSAMSRPQITGHCIANPWSDEFVHIYLHILYIRGHKITNSHCNNLNWTLTTMLLNARNGSTVTRLLPSCILNGSFGELLQCCILKINLNRKDGRKKRRLKP